MLIAGLRICVCNPAIHSKIRKRLQVGSWNYMSVCENFAAYGRVRSGPGKPNQRKVSSWTFAGAFWNKKSMWIVLVFLRKKHQNSQKCAKFMNSSFWPFLWFGLPGRALIGATGPTTLRGKWYSERGSERVPGDLWGCAEPVRPVAPVPVAPFKLLRPLQGRRALVLTDQSFGWGRFAFPVTDRGNAVCLGICALQKTTFQPKRCIVTTARLPNLGSWFMPCYWDGCCYIWWLKTM